MKSQFSLIIDFDSTIIGVETLECLAEIVLSDKQNKKQIINKISNYTDLAMSGQIPFEKSYMTDLLQGLIKESFPLNPVFINGGWIELDSIEDYNLYKKLSEQNRLKELINLEN